MYCSKLQKDNVYFEIIGVIGNRYQ